MRHITRKRLLSFFLAMALILTFSPISAAATYTPEEHEVDEYNALVLGKAAESNNLIQEKYITVSAEKKSVEEARAFFSRVGTDLTTGLSRMSSSVRPKSF